MKTYVLDTSVLLSDPAAMSRFAEHQVVIPVVVIDELERKRDDPLLGWPARAALRRLEDLRVEHGNLALECQVNDTGGTVRVELNHQAQGAVHPSLRTGNNDYRILLVAANLKAEGADVTIVTKDLPLRLRANVAGIDADGYRHEQADGTRWHGVVRIDVDSATIDALHSGPVDLEPHFADVTVNNTLAINAGIVTTAGSQSALARIHPDKKLRLVRDRDIFGLHPRSAEQRFAIDLLTDPAVPVVSLGGGAGVGKSALAITAGLDAVMEKRTHRKVIVFRSLFAVGGQDLGYLPGTVDEKMDPAGGAVRDVLENVCGENVKDEVLDRGLLEVQPITHIRGRTLGPDVWVVVDEAQQYEAGGSGLAAVMSRVGERSKLVLTHDVNQRDNLRVGKHDGIAAIVGKLAGNPLFGHITLNRQERSPVAGLAASLLDDL